MKAVQGYSNGCDQKPNVVGMHYKVGKKIGEGSFGIIHEGVNLLNEKPIAIKFEHRESNAPQLEEEYKTYKTLMGVAGFPSAYYFGKEGSYNCLVISLLGHNLEMLFNSCSRKFTVKTVSMLAIQMIARLKSLHDKGLIYRDIKPDNFLISRSRGSSAIYLVDLGMVKYYRDVRTLKHIPYSEKKSLSGTARYMSINTHMGKEQSRRDDLEVLGNVFVYFLRGSLPWQGLKAPNNRMKFERIGDKKRKTSISDLCGDFPHEFSIYLKYVRNLAFEEDPDHGYLISIFETLLLKMNLRNDGIFDWVLLDHTSRKQVGDHHERSGIESKYQSAREQNDLRKFKFTDSNRAIYSIDYMSSDITKIGSQNIAKKNENINRDVKKPRKFCFGKSISRVFVSILKYVQKRK